MANWDLIKAEYLTGIPPRDLAKKHNMQPETIYRKACTESWVEERAEASKKIVEDYQKLIKENIPTAIKVLIDIMNNPKATDSVRINATKAFLDITGMKSSTLNNNIGAGSGSEVTISINRQVVTPDTIEEQPTQPVKKLSNIEKYAKK